VDLVVDFGEKTPPVLKMIRGLHSFFYFFEFSVFFHKIKKGSVPPICQLCRGGCFEFYFF